MQRRTIIAAIIGLASTRLGLPQIDRPLRVIDQRCSWDFKSEPCLYGICDNCRNKYWAGIPLESIRCQSGSCVNFGPEIRMVI